MKRPRLRAVDSRVSMASGRSPTWYAIANGVGAAIIGVADTQASRVAPEARAEGGRDEWRATMQFWRGASGAD